MKYLITGCFGFVGSYLVEHILDEERDAVIVGVDRNAKPESLTAPITSYCIDLLDRTATAQLIERERPDFLIHLASFSSVGQSWQEPVQCFTNNTTIFLNLLECIRATSPKTRVLSVGSAEAYGVVSEHDLPLRETAPLHPASPYAVARVSQEQLGDVYMRGYGLDIVATRSFNHIGPRQTDKFVVSAFTKQIAEIAAGRKDELKVGTTSVTRDFLHVRDVVRAYRDLLLKGTRGEVYNVCSGRGTTIATILELLERIAGVTVRVSTDPALVRPVENPTIVGSHDKLTAATGWQPRHSLEKTLEDVFAYWQTQL